MTKTVYIWFAEPEIFRDSDYPSGMEEHVFISETIVDGEKEFAKRYSDFSVKDYTYTNDTKDRMYCWADECELLVKENKDA